MDRLRAREIVRRAMVDPAYRWAPVPMGDQARFWRDTASPNRGTTYCILGGNRSGKSEAGAAAFARMVRILVPRWAIADRKHNPVVWVVSPRYELAGDVCWKAKLARMIPEDEIVSISWRDRGRSWPASVRLRCGVEIVFKSADQGREAMQAQSVYAMWIDEQIPADIHDELAQRCLDHSAVVIRSMTPIDPDDRVEAAYTGKDTSWRWYELDIEDQRTSRGGHIPDLMIDRILAQLAENSPEMLETRARGKFAGLSGAIYPQFSRGGHVVDAQTMREWWRTASASHRVFAGVDFGESAPFAFVLGAYDQSAGTWRVLAEHYQAEATIDLHLREMSRLCEMWGVVPEMCWCDTGDTVNVSSDLKATGRKRLAEAGWRVGNARKSLAEGIEAVRSAISRPVLDGVDGISYGTPRLVISSDCTNVIREMATYRRKPSNKLGERPEGVVSASDHAMDALRYMVYTTELTYPRGEIVRPRAIGVRVRSSYGY